MLFHLYVNWCEPGNGLIFVFLDTIRALERWDIQVKKWVALSGRNTTQRAPDGANKPQGLLCPGIASFYAFGVYSCIRIGPNQEWAQIFVNIVPATAGRSSPLGIRCKTDYCYRRHTLITSPDLPVNSRWSWSGVRILFSNHLLVYCRNEYFLLTDVWGA